MAIDKSPLIDEFVDAAFLVPRTLSAPIPPMQRFVERKEARLRLNLRNARVVGELAVRFGRRRVEEYLAGDGEAAPPLAEPAVPRPSVGADPPFDDYDTMPAAHIVNRLPRLDPDDLRAARRYESAHRGRRTVLGKIDHLLGE